MLEEPAEPVTLAAVRRILLATLAIGLIGTGTELLLLGHYEDGWQLAPLVLIGASVLTLLLHAATRGRAATRALQLLMVLCAVNGGLGVLLHYWGNAEFEREMSPSIGGLDLFREAMTGATPALAPGTMVVLALIGLAYTFRHPRLRLRLQRGAEPATKA